MTLRTTWLLFALPFVASAIAVSALLFSAAHGRAVQEPKMSLDMVVEGNGYDATTNSMTVGLIDNCLGTAPPGNNAQHNHTVHLVIQDVEDLAGWQVRMNYDGGKMRPLNLNFQPFSDDVRGQNVAFTNLPLDPGGFHRDIFSAADIPPPVAGPQTALAAAAYISEQNPPQSPDTPPKAPPDDTSYSAPTGGILAAVNLQVLAGQAGQLLTLDLDDANPNPPGSSVDVYTTEGIVKMNLPESALFDGFHAEGVACVPPVVPPAQGGATPGGPQPPGGGPGGAQGSPSPGSSSGSPGASGSATPSSAAAGSPTASSGARGGENNTGNNDNGGTPVWVYVLLIAAVVGLPAAGFAAWRYRGRLPWFRGV